jgi:hypothetical protein
MNWLYFVCMVPSIAIAVWSAWMLTDWLIRGRPNRFDIPDDRPDKAR